MALSALICAYRDSDEPGAPLRATLPLAGRTLVERQVRLASKAGARRIVLLVERMPPDLTAAVDRLRQDRFDLVVARNAEEAGEAIDPNDALLMVADGYIADAGVFGEAAEADGPTLFTVPDSGFDDRYERIDGSRRWAGLARLQGMFLRETTAMLRDWDLQSTLLRRAVQAHLAQRPAPESLIVERGEDLFEAERRILAGQAGPAGQGWTASALAPAEALATARLAPTTATPAMLIAGAALLSGLAALCGLLGFFFAALLLLLLALPLEGIATRLSDIRMHNGLEQSWPWQSLPLLHGAALMALGAGLTATTGWGSLLTAGTTIAFLFAGKVEAEGRSFPGKWWLADRKGLALLLLPFGLFGQWLAGLLILFVYTAGSFFWAQFHNHRVPSPKA